VFRMISDGKEVAAVEERHLDVVIVAAAPKINRVWYAGTFDSTNPAPPDCWSADGTTPDKTAAKKQASNCAECVQNIAGSGQGNSRACRYQQRIAVVLANDMEGDVLQMALPATSIFGKAVGDDRPLQAYAQYLLAQNVDPAEVVTRLKFDTKSESPKLHFKPMRWLSEDEHEMATNQGKTEDAVKAITLTVSQVDGVVAKPMELEGKRPVKAAPAPEPEEEVAPAGEEEAPPPPPKAKKKAAPAPEPEPEEAEEPVVRKEEKKPTVVPATKAKIAALVDDWDNDD